MCLRAPARQTAGAPATNFRSLSHRCMGALGSKILRLAPGPPLNSPPAQTTVSRESSDCTLETSSDEEMPPKKSATDKKTPTSAMKKKTVVIKKKSPGSAKIKGADKKVSFKRGRPASKVEKEKAKPRRKKSKKAVVKRINFNKVPMVALPACRTSAAKHAG